MDNTKRVRPDCPIISQNVRNKLPVLFSVCPWKRKCYYRLQYCCCNIFSVHYILRTVYTYKVHMIPGTGMKYLMSKLAKGKIFYWTVAHPRCGPLARRSSLVARSLAHQSGRCCLHTFQSPLGSWARTMVVASGVPSPLT